MFTYQRLRSSTRRLHLISMISLIIEKKCHFAKNDECHSCCMRKGLEVRLNHRNHREVQTGWFHFECFTGKCIKITIRRLSGRLKGYTMIFSSINNHCTRWKKRGLSCRTYTWVDVSGFVLYEARNRSRAVLTLKAAPARLKRTKPKFI